MKTFILTFILTIPIWSQDYTWPSSTGKNLSSNFGEFRTTGYHLGIDIKTKGTEGHAVHAISNGYISRIVTNYSGFGKALYLSLEDGNTAVYAHLSKFNKGLEEKLINYQEANNSYLANIILSPGQFQFEKGDVIAYSGNTGFSFGPHLHFEIRDKKGRTINPLTNGLKQPDRIAPIVEEISITPLKAESWVNGNQLPQNFPVFRDKKGDYQLPDTINIYGTIGLSIKTYDRREGVKNKYQPHQIEFYVNDKIYHSLKFERLDYNWQSTANYINDYRNARLNLGNFIKLYKNYNDPNIPIHNEETNGILDLNRGYHSIKILIKDAYNNTRSVYGTFFSMAPFEINAKIYKNDTKTTSFLVEPKSSTVPIKSILAYSFTPYGFADQKLKIISLKKIKSGMIVTFSRKQIQRKAIQFIAENNIGAKSMPAHWINKKFTGDYLSANIDLDISHTEAGVYIQIQPEKAIDSEVSLRIKGEYNYKTLSLNQIQPSVYLSKPISPLEFNNIDKIEAIFSGPIERRVQFSFPYTISYPDSSITIISEDGLCSIRTNKKSFTSATLTWIEAVHKYAPIISGDLLSRVYQLQPYQIPLLKPVNIAIRYPRKLSGNQKKHLYFYDQKEGWTFISTSNNEDRRVLMGTVKHLDAIAIIEDNTPPKIESHNPGENGKYPSLELNLITIKIEDLMSGFNPVESSFNLSLNGNPLIYTYQPKLKIITYEMKKPLLAGDHTIQIKIRDQAENETVKNIVFSTY